METEIQEPTSHNRQEGPQLQIATEKQADVKLRKMTGLQAATARQDDLKLAQEEEILRRHLMWNAQGGSFVTIQAMAASTQIRMFSSATHFSLLNEQNQAQRLSQALLKVALCLQHSQEWWCSRM